MASANEVARIGDAERRQVHLGVLRPYVDRILSDGHLTESDNDRLDAVMEGLDWDTAVVCAGFHDFAARVAVAMFNDGRLPVLEPSDDFNLMLRKGEVVHLILPADLLKASVAREWQGGYTGLSFRVAKGIRFNTGSVRGHSVRVGVKSELEGRGALTVTSLRTIFTGAFQSREIPHNKVVALLPVGNRIAFHVSNRASAILFEELRALGKKPILIKISYVTQTMTVLVPTIELVEAA